MTWFPVYTKRHELLGMMNVKERTLKILQEHRRVQIDGIERVEATYDNAASPMDSISVFRALLELKNVWASDPLRPYSSTTIFQYLTIDRPEELSRPNVHWTEAPFVPLGAPLMCEYCPDRKRRG